MLDLPWVLVLAPLSIWWWLFVAVIGFLALWSMEDEDNVAAVSFLATFAAIAYVAFGPGLDILAWIVANPVPMLAWSAGYLAAGVGWCVFKWIRFAVVARDLYASLVEQWELSGTLKQSESRYVASHWPYRLSYDDEGEPLFRPVAKSYKARIANWVLFWPPSVVWTGCREWLLAAMDMVYKAIGGTLDRLSQWIWKDVDFE